MPSIQINRVCFTLRHRETALPLCTSSSISLVLTLAKETKIKALRFTGQLSLGKELKIGIYSFRSEVALSYILAWDPNLEAKDASSSTPLHVAVKGVNKCKNVRIIKSLLSKGASRNAVV
jgi:ankyrin repeat protein